MEMSRIVTKKKLTNSVGTIVYDYALRGKNRRFDSSKLNRFIKRLDSQYRFKKSIFCQSLVNTSLNAQTIQTLSPFVGGKKI